MTDAPSPNDFEADKPGTPDRDRSEGRIEGVRDLGGVFVEAVRAARMAMVLTDPALPGDPIVFANQAFLELSGYARDEVLGQGAHFMNGPDTDPDDAARFAQILADDEDGVVETIQYAKDGRRFVATVLLSAFKDSAGQTIHHFLTWADVTRRVEAETKSAALAESEEREKFLLALGDALQALSDAADIQATTARMVGEHLGVDRAMYGEIEGAPGEEAGIIRGQFVRPSADGAPPVAPFPERFTFETYGGHTMAARYRGEPLVVADVTTEPGFSDAARAAWVGAGVRAAVVVPLAKSGRLVAEFGVHSAIPRVWTDAEVSLIRDVAERTWAAAERARAEAAVRESEEKYAALFAASPAPVLILKPDAPHFTIADVNDAYLAATMRTRDNLIGRAMFDAFPDNPDDPAATGVRALRASLERALASRRFELMDIQKYDIVRPDGTFEARWWKPANAPAVDAQGNVLAIIHHVADVTAEHRAVEALRESEERLALAIAVGQFASWDWDLRSGAVAWNDYHYLVQGYDVGEVTPSFEAWLARVHPDDRARAVSEIEAARDNRVAYAHEFRTLWPDGTVRWCSARGRFFYDDAGEPYRMIGVMEDVTDEKLASEALREREERLRLIVENARDYAIFTTDPSGVVTDWREGAQAVFGYTREEMIGRSGDILYTPEDLAAGEAVKEREEAAATGKAPNVRCHLCKDGSRVFIEGVNTALHDGQGKLAGFLKIGRDVTARHAADQRQQLLLAELQHRVRNLLAMIRAIIRQSADRHDDVDDYVAHLTGRVDAMARTQVVLTRAAGASVDLEGLIRDELAQVAGEPGIDIQGPETALPAKAAEVVTLAMHELATNSLKYGALQCGGRLAVRWRKIDRGDDRTWLDLTWEERCPDPIIATDRRGFGTELIENRVPYELRGEGILRTMPRGVRAEIRFPLDQTASIFDVGA